MLRLPKSEVPGRQIGWYDNSLDAFVKAVENNQPLVVVFGSRDSSLTQLLGTSVLSCPHLNNLAGLAVFTYGEPQGDEYARRMAVHLKLTDYPTISVIAPRTDQLTEMFRMEGFFDAESIANDLQKVLIAGGYWPKDKPLPAKPVAPPYGYLGKGCDPASAARLLGK